MSNGRLHILQGNSLERTGRDAQATVITAFDINVWRLVEVHAHECAHLANVSRKTSSAGAATFRSDLDADLASHRIILLKHQHFVRRHCPFTKQIQTARLHAFHKSFRPETSGLLARASGCDFPALGQRFQHAFGVIVAIGCFLPRDGAVDSISQ